MPELLGSCELPLPPPPELLAPAARVVPRAMRETSGRRLGMQALTTPMDGSALDQMAVLTKNPFGLLDPIELSGTSLHYLVAYMCNRFRKCWRR